MTSRAAQILSPGVPLNLPAGTVTLRYSMAGVAAIDEHFGGVVPMFERLGAGLNGPIARPLAQAIHAGLLHKNAERQLSVDELLDEMDPVCIPEYGDAVYEAAMQAFPQLRRDDKEATAPDPASTTGIAGSTPPSSSSASAPSSSPT